MTTAQMEHAHFPRHHISSSGSAHMNPRITSTGSSTLNIHSAHASTSTLGSLSTNATTASHMSHSTINGDSPTAPVHPSNLLSAPQGNDSLINKQADASQSLYQICLNLKSRLSYIPRMDEYLSLFEMDPEKPDLPADPVYQLWNTLRQGTPLLLLYNALDPENPVKLESAMKESINKRKADVFKFIKGVNSLLHLSADDSFLITHLYSDDTNNFVKVAKVVARCLDELEERGVLKKEFPESYRHSGQGGTDKRSKVTKEFLDTERKYVQDLEALQEYMRALQAAEIVSNDIIHSLFLNLNALLDFQRRFLIRMETISDMDPEKQRWGSLFVAYESNFGVYENFCAHFKNATDLAVTKKNELERLDHPLNKAGLGAFLIKPPQRICKYPLLLSEILKQTDAEDPRRADLEEGMKVATRINNRVNEAIGKVENAQVVDELKDRVEDWKGHELGHFGDLLLHGQFTVVKGDAKGDTEREYQIFLFERILLCCKEVGTGKKQAKTMSIGSNKRKGKKAALQLKGRIFMQNVTDIVSLAKNGDPGVENFIIRHKSEETLKHWTASIHKQVDLWKRDDAAGHRDGPSRVSGSSKHTTSNTEFLWMNGADLNDMRRGSEEETTEDEEEEDDEFGTSAPANMSRTDSTSGLRAAPGASHNMFPPPNKPRYPMSNSASYMQANNPLSVNIHPHTSTLDGSYFSPVETPMMTPMSAQARQQQYPFPRQSTPNSYDDGRNGMTPNVTRSSSREGLQSNSNQRTQRPSLPGVNAPGTGTQNRSRSASSPNIQHLPVSQRGQNGVQAPPMPSLPMGMTSSGGIHPNMSRSATASPGLPLQGGPPRVGNSSPLYQSVSHLNTLPENPRMHGIDRNHVNPQTGSSYQLPDAGTATNSRLQQVGQEFSGAPLRNGTPPITSQDSKGTAGANTNANRTTAAVPSLKVKVSYISDMFVIIVPQNIGYTHLMDRIERKVRLCGGSSYNPNVPLRVRYQDEDGDYITVNSDDDVQMAMESRFHGDDAMGAVTLFVA